MLRPYKGIHPKIAAGCYIDSCAQIIGDVTIGENSSVWMNAVVRGDVYAIKIGAVDWDETTTLAPEKLIASAKPLESKPRTELAEVA